MTPTIEQIKRATADEFSMAPILLRDPTRNPGITLARHVAMYLCRKMTLRSLLEITRQFGRTNHSTTLWAVQKIEAKMVADLWFAERIARLAQTILKASQEPSKAPQANVQFMLREDAPANWAPARAIVVAPAAAGAYRPSAIASAIATKVLRAARVG